VSALELLAVCVAGGVGAGLRFLVDRVVMRRARRHRFPVGILIVNVTGSFALGLLVGAGTALMPSALLTILGTGLLGGYTTFSTVSVETVLLADRSKRAAAANLIGTLALALLAAALGVLAGTALTA
jgi:fluoride exporter